MIWSRVSINGKSLIHIQQDQGTNQCVAASVGMVAQNAKYWGKNENALFSYGARAMRENNPVEFAQVSDRDVINASGIRPNAVAAYLQSYGWNVTSLNASNAANAQAMADRINNMANYDCCILAGGVDQLHAFAAIKLDGATYVLNPAFNTTDQPEYAAFAYTTTNPVQIDPQNNINVQFNPANEGNETFRSVSLCYFIPSQTFLSTAGRWMSRAFGY